MSRLGLIPVRARRWLCRAGSALIWGTLIALFVTSRLWPAASPLIPGILMGTCITGSLAWWAGYLGDTAAGERRD